MLKYKVKLNSDNFKYSELVWGEKYLDPNLSFVSGVTSSVNHLEQYDKLNVSNKVIGYNGSVDLESENVIREGYVIVKNKEYQVFSSTTTNFYGNTSGESLDYQYVFINGKYYYANSSNTFSIDSWLCETDGEIIEKTVTPRITIRDNGSFILIDTIYWIENGFVTIDGYQYYYDKNRKGLCYKEDGDILGYDEITKCSSIIYNQYTKTSDYEEVTKFTLSKTQESRVYLDSMSYCDYYFYVNYKNTPCFVRQEISGEMYSFKCDIPKYIINGNESTIEDGFETFDVYYHPQFSDDDILTQPKAITNENVEMHGVYNITDLKNVVAYIIVNHAVFYLEHDIQNTNDGKEIALYLENGTEQFITTELLRVKILSNIPISKNVYTTLNGERYIIFRNKKYSIEKNICDKALINGNEYDIDYINGKTSGYDCLVNINGEEVPFKIVDASATQGAVMRYGYIVVDGSNSATTATYSITSYDGVVIDGSKYAVQTATNVDNSSIAYVEINGIEDEYELIIDDIIGSSLLVCKPYFSDSDFNDSQINEMSYEVARTILNNQENSYLFSKNKVFGNTHITKDLGFLASTTPKSSDDYFNLFDNFTIYKRSGYIGIPIQIGTVIGGNPMQDEIVKRDFYEKERKMAVNPIIDMEKDIFVPKFISNNNGIYSGAETEFKPISEINFNLHFRTRNLDNWKVNEGYNNLSVSGNSDNWFVTDYYPYKSNLADARLQEMSDLMGLLYFTNYDIYYQKNKIGKSFIRLSYYDSTDPQTQQLLATSTIFMDEHRLFKKYIDNSKESDNIYGIVKDTSSGNYITNSKINVFSEIMKNDSVFDFDKIVNDENRLSSKITVLNKFETDTSSEGFYLYMFKEYSTNLRPQIIYMKVEFNHAGLGRIIPFTIPMKWKNVTSGETHPISALSLANDLSTLKLGIPLSYVYSQSYIPLYAVYDFKNKEYAYIFDDRYFTEYSRNKIYNDGIVNLNLFELKVKDESISTNNNQELITRKQQPKAVIDINSSQFQIIEPTCRN
jgi:hypothetical protein